MSLQVPHVDFSGQDYSNSHGAVGSTPPAPVQTGEPWYNWYGALNPDEREVARVKKVYKNYLKQQLWPSEMEAWRLCSPLYNWE